MARVELIFFMEADGSVPLVQWLDSLQMKAREKCYVRLERLEEEGHAEADYLGDGIDELRAKHLGLNHRMLYFFHGRAAVVVSHGLTKQEARVPEREIRVALLKKKAFEFAPSRHSFKPEG